MLMLQLVVKNLPPEMAEILQIDYRAYCTEVGKSKIQIHTNTNTHKYKIQIDDRACGKIKSELLVSSHV